MSQKLFY